MGWGAGSLGPQDLRMSPDMTIRVGIQRMATFMDANAGTDTQ
jgi:hypothetical protein